MQNVLHCYVERYLPGIGMVLWAIRLQAYIAGDCHEGLMTPEGHIITMPLYEDIVAIGYDTYLCTVSNGDKVIINGKGEVVR